MININDFPDEILTHILSFLPFKQAFRTTILSKRWIPLFHSLAVLNIDNEDMNNKYVLPTLSAHYLKIFSTQV
jgi:hypothetical protein